MQQLEASGDRRDILAVDGNAKLHRRSCGMPFAEVIPSPHLRKLLLRGCSSRPFGKDTLCRKHAEARDKQLPEQASCAKIARHRLRKALHTDGDVCHFEVQLSGFRGWQPACTIDESVLAQHFACQADSNIRRRRERRVQSRKQKWTGMRPRRARTFLAPWHSAGPKEQSLGLCIRCFWLPSFVQSHLYFMKRPVAGGRGAGCAGGRWPVWGLLPEDPINQERQALLNEDRTFLNLRELRSIKETSSNYWLIFEVASLN